MFLRQHIYYVKDRSISKKKDDNHETNVREVVYIEIRRGACLPSLARLPVLSHGSGMLAKGGWSYEVT